MNQELKDAYDVHRRFWSMDHVNRVEDACIEECSELILAFMHRRRQRVKTRVNIKKEILDVYLCLEFLKKFLFTEKEFDREICALATKLKHKLEMAKDKNEALAKLDGGEVT